jgi:hypothetical protein
MKKFFVTLAIFALAFTNVFSQELTSSNSKRPKINTLFGTGETTYSVYGGLHMKMTEINGNTGMMAGARGGLLVNGQFTLGLAGYGLISGRDITYHDVDNLQIDTKINMGYGGIYLEYIHEPVSIIHFTASVLMGFGGATFQDIDFEDHHHNYDSDTTKSPWAAYYVIEPTVSAEVNITDYLRLGVSASYRYMDDFESNQLFQDSQELKDAKMSGFNGGLYIIIGGF